MKASHCLVYIFALFSILSSQVICDLDWSEDKNPSKWFKMERKL